MNENDICSVEDARKYREQLAARDPGRDPSLARWHVCKRCVLFVLLSASFLIYYTVSIHLEILALPTLQVAVPVKLDGAPNRARLTAT